MQTRLSPAIKGLITALVMIGVTLYINKLKDSFGAEIEYVVYAFYAAGILWTLYSHIKKSSAAPGFAELFGQGFRSFIVITLVMVAFTIVYLKAHPEIAEHESVLTKEYYLKQGDRTLPEIEELAGKAKKQYNVTFVSISIFRYLLIGAVLSAAGSALLRKR
jgi:hypothetical protein